MISFAPDWREFHITSSLWAAGIDIVIEPVTLHDSRRPTNFMLLINNYRTDESSCCMIISILLFIFQFLLLLLLSLLLLLLLVNYGDWVEANGLILIQTNQNVLHPPAASSMVDPGKKFKLNRQWIIIHNFWIFLAFFFCLDTVDQCNGRT